MILKKETTQKMDEPFSRRQFFEWFCFGSCIYIFFFSALFKKKEKRPYTHNETKLKNIE